MGGQAQTLENTLKSLDLSRKKLTAEISSTEKKIARATEAISSLGTDIEDKERRMGTVRLGLAEGLRELAQSGDLNQLETLLLYRSMSEYLDISFTLASAREAFEDKTE